MFTISHLNQTHPKLKCMKRIYKVTNVIYRTKIKELLVTLSVFINFHNGTRRKNQCKLFIDLTFIVSLSMGFAGNIFTSISLACGNFPAILWQVYWYVTLITFLVVREITGNTPHWSTLKAPAFSILLLEVPIMSGNAVSLSSSPTSRVSPVIRYSTASM